VVLKDNKEATQMDDYLETSYEMRKRSSKRKPIPYILLVQIPAFVIGTIISLAMLPITSVVIVLCYVFNALKNCPTPREQIRMVQNMYWGG
jgi:hypothetical protein